MPKELRDRRQLAPAAELDAVEGAGAQKRGDLDQLGYDDQLTALAPQSPGPVQLHGGAPQRDPGEVHAAASAGLQGAGQQLPHLDRIQASFGHHDVSGVSAHMGGAAAQANQRLGSLGYASGDAVAFKGTPDLFTAAHEAAHTVQQRGGGVQLRDDIGQAGDSHERHADAVAQRVVQGKSAADLLDKVASSAVSSEASAAIQRRPDNTTEQTGGSRLTPAQVTSAIRYNRGRNYAAEQWAQIAKIVGSSESTLGEELVQKICEWQSSKNLDADGKCGNITTQWLSHESGGEGLENNVTSDSIMFVGMNPSSRNVEHSKLNQVAGSRNVTAIKGSRKQGHMTVDGQETDLTSADGLEALLDSLGSIDASKRSMVKQFIAGADDMSKDELGKMVQHMDKVEQGKALMKRVVLSGHSGGWSFWGDDDGYISFEDLTVLPQIFPNACMQPEDLIMSACNTGQSGKLDQYKAIFPRLKSIWAYVGYSPSAATGSLKHIGEWAAVTKGAMDAEKIHGGRKKIAGQRGKRDKNIAVWTKGDDGAETYQTASPEAEQDYDTIRATVDSDMGHYDAAFKDGNINKSALSTLYTNLQVLVGMFRHRLGGEAERYDTIMRQILFLRYWDTVTHKFMLTHGDVIRDGYGGATQTPNYDGMSRDKVLATIAAYPNPGDAAHKLLTEVLRDMDPSQLPDNWA